MLQKLFKDKKTLLIVGIVILAIFVLPKATIYDISSSPSVRFYVQPGLKVVDFYRYSLSETCSNYATCPVGCSYPAGNTGRCSCPTSMPSPTLSGCGFKGSLSYDGSVLTSWTGSGLGGFAKSSGDIYLKSGKISTKDNYDILFTFGSSITNEYNACEYISGRLSFNPKPDITILFDNSTQSFLSSGVLTFSVVNNFMVFSAFPCVQYDLGFMSVKPEYCFKLTEFPIGTSVNHFPLTINKTISDVKVRYYLRNVSVKSPGLDFRYDFNTPVVGNINLGDIYSETKTISILSSKSVDLPVQEKVGILTSFLSWLNEFFARFFV